MAEILSQSEIDALLAALTSGEVTPDDLMEEERVKKIRTYDFRRPNKFSKEQINTLQVIYDNYSRTLATHLSAQLRTAVQISVLSIEQLTYEEFVRSLPDPSIIIIFNMEPLEGNGIIEIQHPLAFSMIDRLFGGSGQVLLKIRALTEIERAIIERIGQQMLDVSREAWENISKFKPRAEFVETNPQFAQIVSPMEMVILISLETKIGDVGGIINFCFPYIVLEPIIDKLSVHYWYARTATEQDSRYRHFVQKKIESTVVPLQVLLGMTSITVKELLDLQVGDVVPLDKRVDQDLDVLISDHQKFSAKPGIHNKRLAIQITCFHEEGRGLI